MENRPRKRLGAGTAAVLTLVLGLLIVLTDQVGFWRAVVGLALPAIVIWLGFSYFRAAGQSPPEPDAVLPTERRYVCRMCGLEVVVEKLGADRPPTHCREKMELVGL